jgi:hypothetical protein
LKLRTAVSRAIPRSAQRGGSIDFVPSRFEGVPGLRLKSESVAAAEPSGAGAPLKSTGAFSGKVLITKICTSYFETQQIVC